MNILASVYTKTGLDHFLSRLCQAAAGSRIFASGGTHQFLQQAALPVEAVESLINFPEILGGRVKTLHPAIHGGILARREVAADMAQLAQHDIPPLDLVVVTLYPFAETLMAGGSVAECIEKIDIGGVALIRGAAKNHAHVAIVTDPQDFDRVAEDAAAHGGVISAPMRQQLAAKAFAVTAAYDALIARWLSEQVAGQGQVAEPLAAPMVIAGSKLASLRYGENPHQAAALYATVGGIGGVVNAKQLQGKELSYNNLADSDAAWQLVQEFDGSFGAGAEAGAAVAIIKHANPCGVALGETALAAWHKALACDPVSAFGGIIACNVEVGEEVAAQIAALFAEVVLAPSYSASALQLLQAKKNLRVLQVQRYQSQLASPEVKTLQGGFLTQGQDVGLYQDVTVPTAAQPSAGQLAEMRFAFTVAKHVKSNAIVLSRDLATIGIGAGQMSRVDAVEFALQKARQQTDPAGAVIASDAFFPFADGLEKGLAAGITACIQPGGSMRDAEVVAAADQAGIPMVMTAVRHFRH
jgi:phosphoribosylaminoimidazolecarboxamide formyltransferase/IMP cyclohydrolase